jgi:phage-related protein
MPGTEWEIEYYIEDNGTSPVREFILALDPKTRVRIQWSLDQLQVRNVLARAPLVKHIEGKIWELREESQTNIYRILYFFYTGRRIVLLHAFQKKTQKTPGGEIALAVRRTHRYIEREGG